MIKPLVSVVLPTYNGKKEWLSEAIESVLNQTYTNLELIIVNDASTNDIEKTILNFKEKDKRIVYLKNNQNSERSYSKNRGIFESRGKYIAFIDDDDIWSDNTKLEKQIAFLEKNKDYVLCGCSVIVIDEKGKTKKTILVREKDEDIKKNILNWNQIAQSSVLIRKSVLLFSGIYNTDYIPSEDYDLWLRICKYGKIYNISSIFFKYRDRVGNSSNKFRKKQHINGFKSMFNNKGSYKGFFKAIFLRLGYFVLVFLGIKK